MRVHLEFQNKLYRKENDPVFCYTSRNCRVTKFESRGGTPILGHIRDVRPEWETFPGRKPADGYNFLTKNLRMGHNFDVILPGNGWFSSKLNKTYCSLVNFYCK